MGWDEGNWFQARRRRRSLRRRRRPIVRGRAQLKQQPSSFARGGRRSSLRADELDAVVGRRLDLWPRQMHAVADREVLGRAIAHMGGEARGQCPIQLARARVRRASDDGHVDRVGPGIAFRKPRVRTQRRRVLPIGVRPCVLAAIDGVVVRPHELVRGASIVEIRRPRRARLWAVGSARCWCRDRAGRRRRRTRTDRVRHRGRPSRASARGRDHRERQQGSAQWATWFGSVPVMRSTHVSRISEARQAP